MPEPQMPTEDPPSPYQNTYRPQRFPEEDPLNNVDMNQFVKNLNNDRTEGRNILN